MNSDDFYSILNLCLQIRNPQGENLFNQIKGNYGYYYSFDRWEKMFDNMLQRKQEENRGKTGGTQG